jgi:DNA-binding transcriptional LysR family regulator
MKIDRLHNFITVADELNISRAAEKLNISQPPLSNQIKLLERELGAKLFDRKPRLKLTQAGAAFLVEARVIQATLKQAANKTKLIHQSELNGKFGCLTVGFTSSMANGILPQILRNFRDKYPDVRLILSEENSDVQIQRLRDRATDIMFIYKTPIWTETTNLQEILLVPESLVVVLPAKHRLATKATISIADLQDEDLIMPDRQIVPGLFREINDLYLQSGLKPKIALEAVFMVTILGLVAGEIGISILPDSVQNLQRQGVIYRSIEGHTTAINQLSVVWREHDPSTILPHFLDVTRELLNQQTHIDCRSSII